jgi:cyclohexyl-isocyanide hydratase
MDRRVFSPGSIALLSALQRVAARTAASQTKTESIHASIPVESPEQLAMVVYRQMTALDQVGPQTFLAALGLVLPPTMTFADCPRNLAILFVAGGSKGTVALMRDPAVRDLLADRGARAWYVTRVCTGSLVLGALKGVLPSLGAELAPGRAVEDRNRITAGGVTIRSRRCTPATRNRLTPVCQTASLSLTRAPVQRSFVRIKRERRKVKQ